jgi:hypothetical protein
MSERTDLMFDCDPARKRARASNRPPVTPRSDKLDAVPWITETGQLLTAVGVGSILGSLITQFVSRSGERRALRAKVREELSTVEQLRWAKADRPKVGLNSPSTTATLQAKRAADLAAARLHLHAAAMLAHLPRGVVEEYDRLALAAHQSSKESLAADQAEGVVAQLGGPAVMIRGGSRRVWCHFVRRRLGGCR